MTRRTVLPLSAFGALLLALFAIAWSYSEQIIGVPAGRVLERDVTVLSRTDSTVTLSPTKRTTEGVVWGLDFPRGFAQVGTLVSLHPGSVQRKLTMVSGTLVPGDEAALDSFAFPARRDSTLGIEFEDVAVPSDLGSLPSWYFPGDRTTWTIFVHGMGATRAEAIRIQRVLGKAGLPCLVMSYRNDPGAPRDPSGLAHLGMTEWKDVEAAVRYARSKGARDVLLVGYSLGGSIVCAFLRESSMATAARGVILDSPSLDWARTLRHAAHDREIPSLVIPALTSMAQWLAGVRAGIRWEKLNTLALAGRLRSPVLLFHGTADSMVPLETSKALADSRPDLVTLVVIPGAGHVQSWNYAPELYERSLRRWVQSVLPEDQNANYP